MKPEDITDEQVKEKLIEVTFSKMTAFEVFASLSTSAFIDYAHRVARDRVLKEWENATGSQIDEWKSQMAAEANTEEKGE